MILLPCPINAATFLTPIPLENLLHETSEASLATSDPAAKLELEERAEAVNELSEKVWELPVGDGREETEIA